MEDNETKKIIFMISMICLIGVAIICFTFLSATQIEVSGEIECSGLLNANVNETNNNLTIKNIDLTNCRAKFNSKLPLRYIGLIARS